MAIWYIDPKTNINGTGTWANPWSLTSITRTGLANGDEIRIKGYYLTDMHTGVAYTATVTNMSQLTITAGGNLGTDFLAGNVLWVPEWDAFFKIYTIAGNVISVYSAAGNPLPMNSTTEVGRTDLTFYKINTTIHSYISGTNAYILASINSSNQYNNVTVSDCWVDATTRITDGSAKTLIHTNSSINFYPLTASGAAGYICSGSTSDLQNTHVLPSNGATAKYIIQGLNNCTLNLNQLGSVSYGSGGIDFTSFYGIIDVNITINKLSGSAVYGGSSYGLAGKNVTITINKLYNLYGDMPFGVIENSFSHVDNLVINLGDYISSLGLGNSGTILYSVAKNTTINFNGVFDCYATSYGITHFLIKPGNYTLNFSANFKMYYNKRISYNTNLLGFIAAIHAIGGLGQSKIIAPTKVTIPSLSVANYTSSTLVANSNYTFLPTYSPGFLNVEFDTSSNFNPTSYYAPANNINLLITFRNGDSPIEFPSVTTYSAYINANGTNLNYVPKITLDSSVFATTGPSLKAYLTTWSGGIWKNTVKNTAMKAIKIPCVAGTSYTITGKVRTDNASFLAGDCRMLIGLRNTLITSQSMTTACINNWESFSLTFTAAETAEYNLLWEMYFSQGAKSIWLDDVVIS